MEIQLRQCLLLLLVVTLGVTMPPAEAADVQSKLTQFIDMPDYSTLKSALLLVENNVYQNFISATNITFFAPNNTAFSALGNDTLTCLTSQPGPGRDTLYGILAYHTIGSYQPLATAPTTLTNVPTLAGDDVTISIIRDPATNVTTLNGVTKITSPDAVLIPPPVGVAVHGIPAVLLPQGGLGDVCKSLVSLIQADANLKTLFDAVVSVSLVPAFSALLGSTGVTIFAPRNDAFAALGADTLKCLTTPGAGQALLSTILQYHITKGTCDADCITATASQNLTTMSNLPLLVTNVTGDNKGYTVAGVSIDQLDVYRTYQGAVHYINKVLLPPNATQKFLDACNATLSSPPPPSLVSSPPPFVAKPPPPPTTAPPPPAAVVRPPPPVVSTSPPPATTSPPPAKSATPPPPAPPPPKSGAPAGFAAPATALSGLIAALSLAAALA